MVTGFHVTLREHVKHTPIAVGMTDLGFRCYKLALSPGCHCCYTAWFITSQSGFERELSFYGHDRAWCANDVTTRVLMVSTEPKERRVYYG
jgi:hypothetical protein